MGDRNCEVNCNLAGSPPAIPPFTMLHLLIGISTAALFVVCAKRNCFSLPFGFQKEAGRGAAPHTRATARYSARKRHKRVKSAKGVTGGKQEFSPCPRLPTAATDNLTDQLQLLAKLQFVFHQDRAAFCAFLGDRAEKCCFSVIYLCGITLDFAVH